MKSRWILLIAAGLVALPLAGRAADWAQWRGPQRTGVSQEQGLLQSWPAGGPKLLWHAKDVGLGYGSPAVVGDRLYLITNRGAENENLQAMAVQEARVLWTTRLGTVGNPQQVPSYPGARSTPTVDGSRIYALGSDGDLVCVETGTGKERWRKSLRGDFGGQPGIWAYSESPLVDGDALVVTPGGPQASLVALNKNTGAVIWQAPNPGGEQAAYSSVAISNAGGIKQYVQFLQKGVVGVDAKSGKLLWRYDKTALNSPANIPTPVTHESYVYTSTARGGGALVRLKPAGESLEVEPVYATNKLPNTIGGSVLLNGYLYGTTSGGLMCVELATGNVKWQERCVGPASLCYADGCLYVHGENGDVALVEATPDAYREKGRFTPPDGPQRPQGAMAWAYPVVANGRFYVRDLGSLWCYNVKAAK